LLCQAKPARRPFSYAQRYGVESLSLSGLITGWSVILWHQKAVETSGKSSWRTAFLRKRVPSNEFGKKRFLVHDINFTESVQVFTGDVPERHSTQADIQDPPVLSALGYRGNQCSLFGLVSDVFPSIVKRPSRRGRQRIFWNVQPFHQKPPLR